MNTTRSNSPAVRQVTCTRGNTRLIHITIYTFYEKHKGTQSPTSAQKKEGKRQKPSMVVLVRGTLNRHIWLLYSKYQIHIKPDLDSSEL